MKLTRSILVVSLLLILGCKLYTANISWKHSEPSLAAGFKLYCGKYSGIHSYIIDLGIVAPVRYEGTTGVYKVTKPITDRRYKEIRYCCMSAYNSSGNEGPPSTEVPVKVSAGTLQINAIEGGG